MNIPTMNHSTFKAREREVGKTVENVAPNKLQRKYEHGNE